MLNGEKWNSICCYFTQISPITFVNFNFCWCRFFPRTGCFCSGKMDDGKLKYSGTWELGTPKGLSKTVLNSEVVLFFRSISMYWIDLGTEAAVLNSQAVPISQVVLKTGFTVCIYEFSVFILFSLFSLKFQRTHLCVDALVSQSPTAGTQNSLTTNGLDWSYMYPCKLPLDKKTIGIKI